MKPIFPIFAAASLCLAPFRSEAAVLEFAEHGEDSAPSCLFYPINCRMSVAEIGGVRVGLWSESPAKPGVLVSPGGSRWGGNRQGKDASVWMFASGRAKASFRSGRLVRFERDDGVRDEESDRAMLMHNPPRKERSKSLRRKSNHKNDNWEFWAKSGRLRLWFGNPNAAGALFAQIALLGLALALFTKRRWMKSCGAVLCAAVLPALALTGSRGSFAMFAVGTALFTLPFLLDVKRTCLRRALFAAAALAIVALAAATPRLAAKAGEHDLGNAQRLEIWRDAPKMMAAAPDGWNTATGYAWCDWYQPLDDNFTTAWMVNTHLSWLTQYGGAFRVGYVFVWLFALFSLTGGVFASKEARRPRTFALGMLSATFVALWFSTVGMEWELWIAPACAIAFALAAVRRDIGTKRIAACAAIALAVAFCAVRCAVAWGDRARKSTPGDVMVTMTECGVKVGNGEPKTFLLQDGVVLTGGNRGLLGKDIREFYAKHPDAPAIVVARKFEDVPESADTLVLAGRAADAYLSRCRDAEDGFAAPHPKRLVLLSPVESWEKVPDGLAEKTKLEFITGEFAAECFNTNSESIPTWVTVVPASAVYVRDWTERSLLP